MGVFLYLCSHIDTYISLRFTILSTKIMRTFIICILLSLFLLPQASAQQQFVRRTTDLLCLAPAATGLVKAIVDKDRKGILQLGLSSATGIALNYGLNACIKKDRPEMPQHPGWSDRHAFPSTHSMAAFDGATFLMRRYGWKWGVPAYIVSGYVAWGRVYTKHHDWWDVLAGAAVGAGSALIYTRPICKDLDLTIAPASFGDKGGGMYLSLHF